MAMILESTEYYLPPCLDSIVCAFDSGQLDADDLRTLAYKALLVLAMFLD
jgi:hypothetical protein